MEVATVVEEVTEEATLRVAMAQEEASVEEEEEEGEVKRVLLPAKTTFRFDGTFCYVTPW